MKAKVGYLTLKLGESGFQLEDPLGRLVLHGDELVAQVEYLFVLHLDSSLGV